MSEQDQVFGANPKIGKKLCFSHALTWHIRSQDFTRVSLWLQAPYPKGAVPLRGQFSELNLSGFREKLGYPAIDHALELKKER